MPFLREAGPEVKEKIIFTLDVMTGIKFIKTLAADFLSVVMS